MADIHLLPDKVKQKISQLITGVFVDLFLLVALTGALIASFLLIIWLMRH
jgi:hypothetical protein